jgi:hypothetical protein
MMMVEHFQRRMMMTMMTTMATMEMEAKATMAMMEMLSGNVQEECPYDWNEINEEVENGVDKQAAMGSIRNVHVNEDAPIGSTQLGYDQADEGADDDNKNEVANEHGKENGNVHGHNGDRNNYGEGGPSGTAVCCNLHWQWRWWT